MTINVPELSSRPWEERTEDILINEIMKGTTKL